MNTHEHMDFVGRSNSKPRYPRKYILGPSENNEPFNLSEYQKARAKHIAKGGETDEQK